MAEQFDNLRRNLELQEWPSVYLFKFISPSDSMVIARITVLFDQGADLKYKESKKGKYVSISVKEMMVDADSVIMKYKQISKIPGVMAL
jgi:hypothetical protein